jgi:thiol:disulfide interchange protein
MIRILFGAAVLAVCLVLFAALAVACLVVAVCNAGLRWLVEHDEDLD